MAGPAAAHRLHCRASVRFSSASADVSVLLCVYIYIYRYIYVCVYSKSLLDVLSQHKRRDTADATPFAERCSCPCSIRDWDPSRRTYPSGGRCWRACFNLFGQLTQVPLFRCRRADLIFSSLSPVWCVVCAVCCVLCAVCCMRMAVCWMLPARRFRLLVLSRFSLFRI